MWERLVSIDRKWIFLAIGLAVALPFLFSWAISPGPIDPRARNLYDYLEQARPGDAIIIAVDYGPSSMPELHPMATALVRHALGKDLRVLLMTLNPQGSLLADDVLEAVGAELPEKRYGKDYVNLGYKPGGYLVVLGMGDSIPKTFGTDATGKPMADLPIMKGIRNFRDTHLVVSLAGSNVVFTWIIFGHEKFDQAVAAGVTAVLTADIYPYLDTGQLVGALNGLKGAADYEMLIDRPDRAALGMTSQTVAHVLIIFFILLGNVGYFATRGRRR